MWSSSSPPLAALACRHLFKPPFSHFFGPFSSLQELGFSAFSPQGLANLLWGSAVAGLPSALPRSRLRLAPYRADRATASHTRTRHQASFNPAALSGDTGA
jgi:hypothetical protein